MNRSSLSVMQKEYTRGRREAIQSVASNLYNYGFSYTDIGAALGLSKARIGQIMIELKEKEKLDNRVGATNATKRVSKIRR